MKKSKIKINLFQHTIDYTYYIFWKMVYNIDQFLSDIPGFRKNARLTELFALFFLCGSVFIISTFCTILITSDKIIMNRVFAINILLDISMLYYIYRKNYYEKIVERYSGKKYPNDA
jgi:SNF family Na+-dependent transporter